MKGYLFHLVLKVRFMIIVVFHQNLTFRNQMIDCLTYLLSMKNIPLAPSIETVHKIQVFSQQGASILRSLKTNSVQIMKN